MRNILIAYLSNLPRFETGETVKDKVVSYGTELGKRIEAPYTNEAGLRYMYEYLRRDGRQPDMVIAICSGVVKKEVRDEFGGVTALEYFEGVLRKLCPECNLKVVDTKGRMAGGNDIGNVFDAVTDIMPEDRLFLDITGGFRDSVYTLSLVGRFLEYRGAQIEKVIYSLLSGKKKGRITDYTDSYRIIDLINGMSEFVTSGSARTIYAYLTKSGKESLIPLASAMKMFSDRLSLSKTSDLDSVLKDLDSAITALEKSDDSSLDALVIRDMIPVIKSRLFAGDGTTDYPAMIKWCTDNGLIQQALTLYTEKMPRYIFQDGILKADEERYKYAEEERKYEDIYVFMLYNDLLSKVTEVNSSEQLPDGFTSELDGGDLSEILTGYNYIKKMRNMVNHANDESVMQAWEKRFFKSRGYKCEVEFDTLTNELYRCLETVKKQRRC